MVSSLSIRSASPKKDAECNFFHALVSIIINFAGATISAVGDLGPVAPISVNFNHQLAYFADQSDTTHVPHQPTAVA